MSTGRIIMLGCALASVVLTWLQQSFLDVEKLMDRPCANVAPTNNTSLEVKPEGSSRRNNTYNFTTAVCVCVADAEAYFEEWLDYHLQALKFDQIYMYDTSKNFDLKGWYDNTRGHPVYSRVQVNHHKLPEVTTNNKQTQMYRNCVNHYGKRGPKHDYMAFLDIDEFLVLQNKNHDWQDIGEVLQMYLVPFGGALVINWSFFGTANKTVYSPRPVTSRFRYRDPETDTRIKTIVSTKDYKNHRTVHSVYVNNTSVHTLKYPGALHEEARSTKTGASCVDRPSDVMLIYHYRYLSTREYLYKRCVRGQISDFSWCTDDKKSLRAGIPWHIVPHSGTVYDDKAWRFLAERVPKYSVFDNDAWNDFV